MKSVVKKLTAEKSAVKKLMKSAVTQISCAPASRQTKIYANRIHLSHQIILFINTFDVIYKHFRPLILIKLKYY